LLVLLTNAGCVQPAVLATRRAVLVRLGVWPQRRVLLFLSDRIDSVPDTGREGHDLSRWRGPGSRDTVCTRPRKNQRTAVAHGTTMLLLATLHNNYIATSYTHSP
jgi:hypothetical protein